jgi:hypothetical protein
MDLDADDWEPKPAPAKVFEAVVWVQEDDNDIQMDPIERPLKWKKEGWRRIRVREVTE